MPEDTFQRKLTIANYFIKSTPINEVKYTFEGRYYIYVNSLYILLY